MSSCADSAPPETVGSPTDVDVGGFVGDVGAVLLEVVGLEVVGFDVTVVGAVGTCTDGDVGKDVEPVCEEDEPLAPGTGEPEVGTTDTGTGLDGSE